MNAHSGSSTASVEVLLGRVADEFTESLKRGEQPEVEEYAKLHPQIAELLRQVLPALLVMGPRNFQPSRESADGHVTLGGYLGDYRILNEVGRGGMGIVYEAEQISLRRRVALKVLPFAATLEPKRLQRFRNEAQAAAQLHHANIVPVFAVGCERSVHFYAMQYIEGQSLAAVIEELRQTAVPSAKIPQVIGSGNCPKAATLEAPLDTSAPTKTIAGLSTERSIKTKEFFRTVAELGVQAAQALDYAHEMGVVHRDIKPANLLVDSVRNLWITDFGLAQIKSDACLTVTGDLVGTVRYMSPEQALGKRVPVDHRADIYSLGATLYEMLTLQPVFAGSDRQELLEQIANIEPVPPRRLSPAIPRELETIVLKAMEKDSADRYLTSQELGDDLLRFLEDKPIQARRPPLWQRGVKWVRRHRLLVAASMALFAFSVIGLAVSAVLIIREREASRRRDEAEIQSALLVERELAILRRYYTEDVLLAKEAWTFRDINEMRHLLHRYQPGPNSADLSSQVRGFEWYYLRWLCFGGQHSITTLRGHIGEVYGVSFSPDGQTLASVGKDQTVRLWDVASGKTRKVLTGHTNDVNGVAFSPDGTMLATVSEDNTVKLWNTAKGSEHATLRGHTKEILCVAYSPDGKQVASGGYDSSVRIWDVATGRPIEEFQVPQATQLLTFSSNGDRLAAACGQGISWSLKKQGKPLVLCLSGVYSIAYASHDSLIVTGHRNGDVSVWNSQTGKQERSWRAHSSEVDSLAFSPDGGTLITTDKRGTIRSWVLNSGEMHNQWTGHSGGIWCIATSPHHEVFATAGADGTVKLWRMSSLLEGPRDHVVLRCSVPMAARLAFVPHSTRILTGHDSLGKVVIWDWKTRQSEILCQSKIALCGLAVTPDGTGMILGLVDGRIEFWDLAQRKLRHTIQSDAPAIAGLVVSPNGRWLGTSGEKKASIRLWDLHKDSPRFYCSMDGIENSWLTFSPHSHDLATFDPGTGAGELWDLNSQQPKVRTLIKALDVSPRSLLLSPDGTMLAAGGADQTLRLIEVATGQEKARWRDGASKFEALAFSPDCKTLAVRTWDGIRLFNIATARMLIQLALTPSCFAFSPDGMTLAAPMDWGDGKTELCLWFAPREDEAGLQK